jgi:signal transduction histidine kinase
MEQAPGSPKPAGRDRGKRRAKPREKQRPTTSKGRKRRRRAAAESRPASSAPAHDAAGVGSEKLVAEHQVRAVAEFAFGIAHDVNNLLGALRLRVGILLKDPVCLAAQAPNLTAIDRILTNGSELVAKLRHAGLGKPPSIKPVDLAQTILGAVEIAQSGLRLLEKETSVQILIKCTLDRLPRVRGYPEDLRCLFVNLLLNARDAMPDGGTVSIRSRVQGSLVRILVEDEGIGIRPEHLPRIFDAFFTTKGSRGTGLGLAMAKNLMHRLGGTIVASNRPKGGACFELCFAAYDARAREPLASRRPPAPRYTGAHGSSRPSATFIT